MQTPSNLRWDDLRVLLALYRHGSLKRGAQALGVNISTASRRLDTLEAVTGVHLFDRTPEGTRPTAAAELLVPYAESMEQAAIGFSRGLESFELEPEGEVRITAPPGLVDSFLAPALPELCDAYPKLRLNLLSSIGYADLTRREADIALRLIRPGAGDLVSRRVGSEGMTVIASVEHARWLGTLRDLDATRWVTWGDDLAHLADRQWVFRHVSPGRIALLCSSMTAQLSAVRAGYGVMIANDGFARLPGVSAVRLTPKLKKLLAQLPEGSLWLVGHRALREVPRIAAVWNWLCERFEAGHWSP